MDILGKITFFIKKIFWESIILKFCERKLELLTTLFTIHNFWMAFMKFINASKICFPFFHIYKLHIYIYIYNLIYHSQFLDGIYEVYKCNYNLLSIYITYIYVTSPFFACIFLNSGKKNCTLYCWSRKRKMSYHSNCH